MMLPLADAAAQDPLRKRPLPDFHLGALGSGSDYVPFLDHAGVASLNLGFGGEDAIGVYHSAYDTVNWFDEFSASLGQSVSSPPTSAWQNGVYRRDFASGIALVNPKGNGPQTVKLETSFVKIKGTQAPSINNGSTVTSVSLADRDGIVLLRQAPVTQPNPPTSLKIRG